MTLILLSLEASFSCPSQPNDLLQFHWVLRLEPHLTGQGLAWLCLLGCAFPNPWARNAAAGGLSTASNHPLRSHRSRHLHQRSSLNMELKSSLQRSSTLNSGRKCEHAWGEGEKNVMIWLRICSLKWLQERRHAHSDRVTVGLGKPTGQNALPPWIPVPQVLKKKKN